MKQEKYRILTLNFESSSYQKITSGSYYSFLFVLSGNCQFFDNHIRHRCGFEDIILLNINQSVTLEKINYKQPLELLLIQYSPVLITELSDHNTNLKTDLDMVPYTAASIRASSELGMLCKNLINRLLHMKTERPLYADALFEKNILSMLIILILRACIQAEFRQHPSSRKTFMIDNLFSYIHTHLTEEITLDMLEQTFFISKYHIMREFKRETGQTVHSYIIKMKLELCKKYIEEGLPITEVYQLGGFGGYNHFFRAFKKEYAMTPKDYYKSTLATLS